MIIKDGNGELTKEEFINGAGKDQSIKYHIGYRKKYHDY